jgi:hypothetical protein
VTFRIEETLHGVRVHIAHSGFEEIRAQDWERTLHAYQQGWDRHHLLENLRDAEEA